MSLVAVPRAHARGSVSVVLLAVYLTAAVVAASRTEGWTRLLALGFAALVTIRAVNIRHARATV